MTIKKTEEVITTTQEPKTNIYSVHPPIGQKPEGDVDLEGALDRFGETIKGLMKKSYSSLSGMYLTFFNS